MPKSQFQCGTIIEGSLLVYTKRQEICQCFAADMKVPIMEATMINTSHTHVIANGLLTTMYCEWKWLNDENKTWSKVKEHYNKAFNKLQELNEIIAGGAGFGANAMKLTLMAIDEISSTLDNLANATVQKTDVMDKLAVALRMTKDKISQLNKIIKLLATDNKRYDKLQKNWDPKGYFGVMVIRLRGITPVKPAKINARGKRIKSLGKILWADPVGIDTRNPRQLDGAYQ